MFTCSASSGSFFSDHLLIGPIAWELQPVGQPKASSRRSCTRGTRSFRNRLRASTKRDQQHGLHYHYTKYFYPHNWTIIRPLPLNKWVQRPRHGYPPTCCVESPPARTPYRRCSGVKLTARPERLWNDAISKPSACVQAKPSTFSNAFGHTRKLAALVLSFARAFSQAVSRALCPDTPMLDGWNPQRTCMKLKHLPIGKISPRFAASPLVSPSGSRAVASLSST